MRLKEQAAALYYPLQSHLGTVSGCCEDILGCAEVERHQVLKLI